MIKQLKINNLQSHKNTTLELDKGVNIIIGSSDTGKTAILRALRWVMWNKPTGNAFRSDWGGETKVELTTETDTIIRSKDKVEEYKLNETSFKSFKTEVPQEIIQALNISETNLQQQHDKSFLLSSTSGEVASHFNKVARLEKIDTATTNINKWIGELKTTIKFKTEQKEKDEEKLKKFEHLEKFEADVEVLEGMENQLNKKRADQTKLNTLIEEIEETEQSIEQQQLILQAAPLVNNIFVYIEERNELLDDRDELNELIAEIEETELSIKNNNKLIPAEDAVKELLKFYSERVEKITEANKLDELVDSIEKTTASLKTAKNKLSKLEEEFKDNFPDVCFLCGQIVKK